MYTWRYLVLGVPSAGLLAPVAVLWMLGRFEWRRVLIAMAIALPLWILAVWQTVLGTALLWFVGLLALNAWLSTGTLKDARAWMFSGGLLLTHLFMAGGLSLMAAYALQANPSPVSFGVGLLNFLLALLFMEWMVRRWRRHVQELSVHGQPAR